MHPTRIMASLSRQQQHYYLSFSDTRRQPNRKKVSLRVTRRKDAVPLKVEMEAAYARGIWDPWVDATWPPRMAQDERSPEPTPILGEALDAFLESRAGCRKPSADHHRWVLRSLERKVGSELPAVDLSARRVTDWLQTLSPNPTTRHTYLSRVGIFARWLVRQGWLQSDISKEVTIQRPPDKLASKLIRDEDLRLFVQRATASTTLYMADVAVVGFDLAMRLGELCAARIGWVDFEKGVMLVHSSEGFSTKDGGIVPKPMTERALAIAERLSSGRGPTEPLFLNTRGKRLSPKPTSKRFKKIAVAAGHSRYITFHGLRHGGISKAVKNGAPVEAVRRFAWHSTVAMTMRYVHLHEDAYLKAVRAAMS